MKNLKKTVFRVQLSILSCFFAFYLAFHLTETYFFDKVFLGKSTLHGYKTNYNNSESDLVLFGKRSEGIRAIQNFLAQDSEKIKGVQIKKDKSDEFLVVVIGDSYVWGQGVRNEFLFPVILENKLNKIRSSKVIAFGSTGDTIFDNYEKYKVIMKMGVKPNVVIFGLVDNDLLLLPTDNFTNFSTKDSFIFENCKGEIITQRTEDSYGEDLHNSFRSDTFNYCGFLNVLTALPKKNAIYFSFWDSVLEDSDLMAKYTFELASRGFRVITPSKEFIKYMGTDNFKTYMEVQFHASLIDHHPSALSHELFAESLFSEITNNPIYQFQ